MDTVGIRQLRESIGTYDARAGDGERIVATDR